MDLNLISTMASLSKVCRHVCLPLQAGDDLILKAMNRHYSVPAYKLLVQQIREHMPDIALSTDIIVGFPGETDEQYMNTLRTIEEIRFDTVHVAAYSQREGTIACNKLPDNVPNDTKISRLHEIESIQTEILLNINKSLVGTNVEILIESKKGAKWFGRTMSDKLVFFQSDDNFAGKLATVNITSASPWALQGTVST